MAAKSRPKAKPKSSEETLPDGYTPVANGKLDGWFVVKEGNAIEGVLLDTFVVKGEYGEKRVYKVRVTGGDTLVANKDDGEFNAGEGDVIGLDEKGWLKGLANLQKGTGIYVRCVGKEATARKGQQPAWKFLVGTKSVGDDTDVPF